MNILSMGKVYMSGKITEKIPYGFMRHEKYDIVVMDSEKMESVKLMFSLCLDGMSLGQIKSVIESQGIEYPAKYKKDKIVGWPLAEIRKILSDPIYRYERYGAIAKEELEIARRMLTLNTRVVGKRMEISALVGIAVCKECGSFLVEKSVSTRGRTYLYYVCGKNKKGKGCSTHKIAVQELDKKVLEEMRKEIGDREVLRCKGLTREIAIGYLKYVSIDSAGNIKVIWNT